MGHGESKGISKKKSASASLAVLQSLTVWITKICGKILEMMVFFQKVVVFVFFVFFCFFFCQKFSFPSQVQRIC